MAQIHIYNRYKRKRVFFISKNYFYLLQKKLSYKARAIKLQNAYAWFRHHKIKAFYSLVDGVDLETGAKALLQASGIGKLTPNVLMLGYKNDWKNCNSEQLLSYFNILQ